MEKRLIIAVLLSFVFLYFFKYLSPPIAPDKAGPETEARPAETETSPPAPSVVSPSSESPIQAESITEEPVESELYRAVVSNVGGVLKSVALKAPYLDGQNKPIEMIDPYAGKTLGYPLVVVTADPQLNKLLAEAKYVIAHSAEQPLHVSMEYSTNGVHSLKILDFDPDKYVLTVSTELSRNGIPVPHQLVWQGEFGDQSLVDVAAKRRAVYYAGGKFQRVPVTGIKEAQEAPSSLVGVEDQYFLAMFIQSKEGQAKFEKQTYKLPDLADGTTGAEAQGLLVSVPMTTEPVQVYVGPKLESRLRQADPRLEGVIDYGWFLFAAIAKPLLVLLRWIESYVGNWGWAIIILTCLINTVLFPLRIKQQLGMQRMQKLAPHLKQLQEKYKKLKPGDPRRAEVEQEIMVMNKQQLAGCLPLLLQMPLLFAFLNMMSAAIELRGTPWILWIRDLSQPDSLYILPIAMGVAMFVQMKMSPSTPDPAQAKMMTRFTPILVTLLFIWYGSASGLTLYWLTGNVISIGQQWIIKKYWSDDDRIHPRQAAPA